MLLRSDETTKAEAIARLNEVKPTTLARKERAVCGAIRNALTDFCKQETEFAQAVLDNDSGFEACLKAVVSGCGECLSDIEAYRRAVSFYFPGAGVNFTMSINLCASVDGSGDDKAEKSPDLQPTAKAAPALNLSLDDLLL